MQEGMQVWKKENNLAAGFSWHGESILRGPALTYEVPENVYVYTQNNFGVFKLCRVPLN